MLPHVTDDQVQQAFAVWGDEVGAADALAGNPEDPGRHCPSITFADHYTVAYAETLRAMAELARMEFPHAGVGDSAGGAQGTRPTGNTLRWRDRILYLSVGLAIGSWCTGIAVYVSTVLP